MWGGILLTFLFLGAQSEENSDITIIATGDTMLGSWAQQVMIDSGYAYPFGRIQTHTESADIFFTNLEAPFGKTGKPFDKKFTFQVKPDLVKVLSAGGINLVSLANNHTMDFGLPSLLETTTLLDEQQIQYAGAGRNLQEARRPAMMVIKGRKIGFLSYSLTFPEEFWASDTSAGTCFPYAEFVFGDVARLAQESDFVIVSCHWGQELLDTPKPYQIKLAHQLIDKGADLVLGHHPHIIQGMEIYKGKLIAYSLGNFIFGSYSESARDSYLLKVTLLEGSKETKAQVIPISVYNKAVEFRPELLSGAEQESFFRKLKTLSSELNNDSFVISSEGYVTIIKS